MVDLKARIECRSWCDVGVTVVYDFKPAFKKRSVP